MIYINKDATSNMSLSQFYGKYYEQHVKTGREIFHEAKGKDIYFVGIVKNMDLLLRYCKEQGIEIKKFENN